MLFICSLLKSALIVSEYIASKDIKIMNRELEGTWMESLILDRTAICLQAVRKFANNLNQDGRCP